MDISITYTWTLFFIRLDSLVHMRRALRVYVNPATSAFTTSSFLCLCYVYISLLLERKEAGGRISSAVFSVLEGVDGHTWIREEIIWPHVVQTVPFISHKLLFDFGIYALHANNDTSVLQFLMPLTITDSEIEEVIDIIKQVFEDE